MYIFIYKLKRNLEGKFLERLVFMMWEEGLKKVDWSERELRVGDGF